MNLRTNLFRSIYNSLAVVILCAGILLFSCGSPSCADEWKPGETRQVSGGYIVNGRNYPVIKGTYRFPSSVTQNDTYFDGTAVFFYSDGFFAEDPYKYNPHIAAASMCMAMAGCYSNEGATGRTADYSRKNKNALQYLKDIGCSDIRTNIYNNIRPQTDSIGVTLGSKSLPDGKALLAVTLRSINYEREWANNVTFGSADAHNGEAQGFAEAADMVVQEIESYISSRLNGYSYSNIIFWLTGFSRGAAVTNLTAKRLVDICYNRGITKPAIFAYCLATPKGGSASAELSGADYTCIHNVIIPDDLLPRIAPDFMGFKRYGVDHYIPGTAAGAITNDSDNTFSRNAVDNNVMLQHLKAVNKFVDASQLKGLVPAYGINISLINREMFLIGITSYIDYIASYFTDSFGLGAYLYDKYKSDPAQLIPTKQNVWLNEFFDDFVSNFHSWTGLSRNLYIGKSETGLIEGVPTTLDYGNIQQALRDVMTLLNDLPESEREAFSERISEWASGDKLGTLDLVAKFYKAFGNYHTYSSEEKNKVKNKLVDWLNKSGCFDVLSLTPAQKDRMLNYDLRTLTEILMTYLSQDYRHPLYGVEGLTQFLTLLSAIDTVKMNHYPEVSVAWLRAMDTFYANETGEVTRLQGTEDESDTTSDDKGARELAGTMPVDDVITEHGADYISLLPKTTYVEYTNGDIEEAGITWDTANYERYYYNDDDIDDKGEFAGWTLISGDDTHTAAAHRYEFTGKVNIPDDVVSFDEVDREIHVSVFVAGLPRMEAPDCLIPDGDYVGSITISFDIRANADIYYAINGEAAYEKYTEPFTLELGVAVSEDYSVTVYTKASGKDRADSRPVIWSYTLWRSEAAMIGEDTGENNSTVNVSSSGGGCEVNYRVYVFGLLLTVLIMRRKVRG